MRKLNLLYLIKQSFIFYQKIILMLRYTLVFTIYNILATPRRRGHGVRRALPSPASVIVVVVVVVVIIYQTIFRKVVLPCLWHFEVEYLPHNIYQILDTEIFMYGKMLWMTYLNEWLEHFKISAIGPYIPRADDVIILRLHSWMATHC